MTQLNEDEQNQRKIWDRYAERGYLQSTIDPNDEKGLKCNYIDLWSQYYLRQFLPINKKASLLEVGCGSGRNLFSLAPHVNNAFGIDVSEKQINNAERWKKKKNADNIFFFNNADKLFMLCPNIRCLFTMWVLQGFRDDINLLGMIRTYMARLPTVKTFIFFEQVATQSYVVEEESSFYKKIRTVKDYKQLFSQVGLRLIAHKILNEKGFGLLYRCIYMTKLYRYWPRWLNLNKALFFIDRSLVKRQIADTFTDVVFVCIKGTDAI